MFTAGLLAQFFRKKKHVKSLSRVRLFAASWTVAYQAPQPMEFSRQEYRNGLPFLSPGDLPDPGIEPRSPILQADTLASEPPGMYRPNRIIPHLSSVYVLSASESQKLT